MLDSTGLDGAVIDVDAIALVNALLMGCTIGDTETLAVVNIGSDVTNIAILRHRMLRFTRDLNIAGRNITRSIMSELNVDYEKAEELKGEHGLKTLFGDDEAEETDAPAEGAPTEETESHGSIVDEVYAAIDALDSSTDLMGTDISSLAGGEGTVVATLAEQVLSDIASEVKRSLLFYENQMDGEPVDRVLIAGGTSQLPGVVQYFEKEIDSQVELMQPLAKIENDLSAEYREQMGPSLATGIGLALRCAN
jgi:type IV pilus assembly protein PilM